MSDPRYITVALEVFDLHHSLEHRSEFDQCSYDFCQASSVLVLQHAMAELLKARQQNTVLSAGVECEEIDFDSWGDHHGGVRPYRVTSFILGKRPSEIIHLCDSHRRYRTDETSVLMKGRS